jgi:hypothetical protein
MHNLTTSPLLFANSIRPAEDLVSFMETSASKVDQFVEDLKTVHAFISRLRSKPPLSALIQKLPVKLLSTIFTYCVQHRGWGRPWTDTYFESVSPKARITLLLVCHRWREVCMRTRSLWGFIDFGDGKPYSQTSTYIERARNSSLHISINKWDDSLPHDDFLKRFHLVTPFTSKWCHLNFSGPMEWVENSFLPSSNLQAC